MCPDEAFASGRHRLYQQHCATMSLGRGVSESPLYFAQLMSVFAPTDATFFLQIRAPTGKKSTNKKE